MNILKRVHSKLHCCPWLLMLMFGAIQYLTMIAWCYLWDVNVNTLFSLNDKLKETTNARPPDWNLLMWQPHHCTPSHGFPSYTWPHFLSSWLQVYKSHSVKFLVNFYQVKKTTHTRLPGYGLVSAPHFQPLLGREGNPGQMLKEHPALSQHQIPLCGNHPLSLWLEKLPSGTKQGCFEARETSHVVGLIRAVTKDTSLQLFSLSSDVIDLAPQDWRLSSFSQAGHASIIKLPGFNFQPLPNCLFRHVESQTHSFFPPVPGDWSSLMIVLWGGGRDADQEQLESDEREEL